MKTVILAGGHGTRLSEETGVRPKPMVEIGGQPILWHIMKIYSCHGIEEFIICAGYRGDIIKQYFSNYLSSRSDITYDLRANSIEVHESRAEPWRVTVVDTGLDTMTGGRLKRIEPYLDGGTFCVTYGDGVADIDVARLIEFHRAEGVLATLTAVQPPGRFGAFRLKESETRVGGFREKPSSDGAWINGGFFVLEPAALAYIAGDSTVWEREPMERLAKDGQLAAYRHAGFWHPMDTLQDKMSLERLWEGGEAPWKRW